MGGPARAYLKSLAGPVRISGILKPGGAPIDSRGWVLNGGSDALSMVDGGATGLQVQADDVLSGSTTPQGFTGIFEPIPEIPYDASIRNIMLTAIVRSLGRFDDSLRPTDLTHPAFCDIEVDEPLLPSIGGIVYTGDFQTLSVPTFGDAGSHSDYASSTARLRLGGVGAVINAQGTASVELGADDWSGGCWYEVDAVWIDVVWNDDAGDYTPKPARASLRLRQGSSQPPLRLRQDGAR